MHQFNYEKIVVSTTPAACWLIDQVDHLAYSGYATGSLVI